MVNTAPLTSTSELARLPDSSVNAWRLINSKFPPINVFDDVADASEFEALYALQALTNPRLRNEVGDLELIPRAAIPFGIPGCSYAVAPFTHINPAGSRFSDGSFGVLYLADSIDTAMAEVRHHQQSYWRNVPDLRYERFVLRSLNGRFSAAGMADALPVPRTDPLYSATDYSAAQRLGQQLQSERCSGIRYHSVRYPGGVCWGLLTPQPVQSMVQAGHYEMIWSGAITAINQISASY